MDEPGSKRGRTHDAEGARQAILDAAEDVFAEHGFDGARVDVIARVAGYNKSLIFQYFDDKLGLYASVIRRADDQTRGWQNEALSALWANEKVMNAGQIRNLLRKYVGEYFDYLLEHPRIQRIYMWEMAEGWQTFSKILSQRDFDDVDQFAPILAKLQDAGLLRSKLNPLLQLSTSLFTGALYLSLLPFYRVLVPDLNFSSPGELANAREFVVEFTVNGLLILPSDARP